MSISICKRSLQNARKLYRRLSNCCFTGIIPGKHPLVNRSMSTRSLFSTTDSSARLLQLELYYFQRNTRCISITKSNYLKLVLPLVCCRFYTSAPYKHYSALSIKTKKRVALPRPDKKAGVAEVVAYAISQEIDLKKLEDILANQKLYKKQPLPFNVENAIYIKAVYEVDWHCREVFLFREGAIVFWDMSSLERTDILQQVCSICDSPYDLLTANENLTFCHTDNPHTDIKGHEIQFSSEMSDTHLLEKYVFSNSLGMSVKLTVLEESLALFVELIEPLVNDLMCERTLRIAPQKLLRRIRELFTIRHLFNLSSDLLDTRNFYSGSQRLELLYHKTNNYLNVANRTRVMSKRFKHCCELVELISVRLTDQHHTRLEVMIIGLILFEVISQILRSIDKYSPGIDADWLIPFIDT